MSLYCAFKFDDPDNEESLLYVNLGGRGIRSLARVDDGFLIIAGPVGDAPVSYQIYFWDGEDLIVGKDRLEGGRATFLKELLVPIKETGKGEVEEVSIDKAEARASAKKVDVGKAEGLVVLEETNEQYDVIVVFDGIAGPQARRYQIAKPGS